MLIANTPPFYKTQLYTLALCSLALLLGRLQSYCITVERLLTIVDYEEGSFQDYPGGHSDTVHRVEFSNDGNTLYSLCDNTVFLWTVLI